MQGKLELEGKLGFSAGVFSGNASKSKASSIEADFFFLEEADSYFGTAASENIKSLVDCGNKPTDSLCSPFQVKDLTKLLTEEDLQCLKITADSTLKFDINLGLAKSYEKSGEVKVKLGMDIGSTVKETGKFDYTLSAHNISGESVIAVHIKRNSSTESTHKKSFSVEIDASGLAKKLQPMLEDNFGKAEEALKEFKDLLPGSDYINDKLTTVIDEKFDDSKFKQAIRVLVGIDSTLTPEQSLRDKLIGIIETSAEGWSVSINTAVPGIVDELVAQMERFTPDLPDIRPILETATTAALKEKQAALKEKINSAIPDSNSYKKIAEKINAAGEKIAASTSDLQKGIDNATVSVNNLLDKLQKRINTLRDLSQVATEKTVSLVIASERKEIKQQALDLRFDLYPDRNEAEAQAALNAILLGDMSKAIKAANKTPSNNTLPAVVAISGGLSIYQKLSETNSTDLVLWDLNIGTKSILDVDLSWTVNIDGSITTTTDAEYKRISSTNSQKRTVAFFQNTEMLFASNKSTINAGLTISREDEELSFNEVKLFLSGLVERKLVSEKAINKARVLLDEKAGKHLTRGRLEIGISFSQKQLNRMLDGVEEMYTEHACTSNDFVCVTPSVKCPENAGKTGCHWVLDTVAKISAENMYKHHSDRELIKLLDDVLKKLDITGGLEAGIKKMTPEAVDSYVGSFHEDDFPYYDDFSDLYGDLAVLEYRRYGAMALYEILAHMKKLRDTGVTLSANTTETTLPFWTIESLKNHHYRTLKILPVWWQWGHHWKEWAFLTDQMRSTNIALIESWVTLARGPDGEGEAPEVWVSLSQPNKDNVLVPELLT